MIAGRPSCVFFIFTSPLNCWRDRRDNRARRCVLRKEVGCPDWGSDGTGRAGVRGQARHTCGAAHSLPLRSEKISGVVTDRRELAKAIASLTCGDLLIVTKLDRSARSTRDLLNTIAAVTDKGAGFRVLDNPAMDTTSAHERLLLNILGSIAEIERELRAGSGNLNGTISGVSA